MRNPAESVCATIAAVAALGVLGHADAPAASAVAAHPELHEAQVAWCLKHPSAVKAAAIAHGVFEETTAGDDVPLGPDGQDITVIEWAQKPNAQLNDDFEKSCRTAFLAFSRAGVDVALNDITARAIREELQDESLLGVSDEGLLGVGGVIVGALLTGALGAAVARHRSHADDADRLRELDAALQATVVAYLADPRNDDAQRNARTAGYMLRSAVVEWSAKSGHASAAIEKLTLILDGRRGPTGPQHAPYIGNLGDLNNSALLKQNSSELLKKTTEAHVEVAEVAHDVSKYRRIGGPEAKTLTQGAGGSSG